MKKVKHQKTSQFSRAETASEFPGRYEDAIRHAFLKRGTKIGAGISVATIQCSRGFASKTGMPHEHWKQFVSPLSIMPSNTTSSPIVLDFSEALFPGWEPGFATASGTAVVLSDEATVPSHPSDTEARSKTQAILLQAMEEVFEDGVESRLSRDIESLIRECGIAAIDALRQIGVDDEARPSVIAEVLRTLGRFEDDATREARFKVLSHFLGHRSPVVRNGAFIGLSETEDQRAVAAIRQALAQERNRDLKRFMEKTLTRMSR